MCTESILIIIFADLPKDTTVLQYNIRDFSIYKAVIDFSALPLMFFKKTFFPLLIIDFFKFKNQALKVNYGNI